MKFIMKKKQAAELEYKECYVGNPESKVITGSSQRR